MALCDPKSIADRGRGFRNAAEREGVVELTGCCKNAGSAWGGAIMVSFRSPVFMY